jgi:hypothetical protein
MKNCNFWVFSANIPETYTLCERVVYVVCTLCVRLYLLCLYMSVIRRINTYLSNLALKYRTIGFYLNTPVNAHKHTILLHTILCTDSSSWCMMLRGCWKRSLSRKYFFSGWLRLSYHILPRGVPLMRAFLF